MLAKRCVLKEEVDMLRVGRISIVLFKILHADLRNIRLFPKSCVDGEPPSEYRRGRAISSDQGPPHSLAYTLLVYGQARSLEADYED